MSTKIHTKAYQNFIKKLKEARVEIGMRQIDVAKKLKKYPSYVSKIESGERRVDVTELYELAKLYKKDLEFFVNR